MPDTFRVETYKEDGVWLVFVPQLQGQKAAQAESFSQVEDAARHFIATTLDRDADSIDLAITHTSAVNDDLSDRMFRIAYDLMVVIGELKDRPGAENYDFSPHRAAINRVMAHLLGAHQDTQ